MKSEINEMKFTIVKLQKKEKMIKYRIGLKLYNLSKDDLDYGQMNILEAVEIISRKVIERTKTYKRNFNKS